jgi:hypothetical protein
LAKNTETQPTSSSHERSSEDLKAQFSRINRRCSTLVTYAHFGQLGAEGIFMARDIGKVNEFVRERLGDGLEFVRYMDTDLNEFQDGDFEFRAGLESCNLAKIMEEVFGLRDLKKDRKTFEQVRKSITQSDAVIRKILSGKQPPSDESTQIAEFIQEKSDGYETVAHKATEQAIRDLSFRS